MPSISARITVGFYALAFLLLILSAVTYSDLRFLAAHIREGSATSAFAEQVMEMRRLEKNYFLYQERTDLSLALQSVADAMALLEKSPELFQRLCPERACAGLDAALIHYREMLAELVELPAGGLDPFEEGVRQAGHQITEMTRDLSRFERTTVSTAMVESGRWLLGAVLLVGLVGVVLGSAIARSVVRPLRKLESDLAPIGAGRFRELPAPSTDRELVSFAAAFNHTLDELEQRRRQLVQSEKLASLGVLVSGVAHELNNPLSNISTSCQLAMEEVEGGDPKQLTAWLEQIDEQTERARHIVLALSDYARRRPLTLEPVAVNQLLDTTLLLVRKELGHQVTLERAVPEGLAILADRQRLQQIFINLLKNAADAGGPGVTIRVSGQPLDQHTRALPQGRYRLGELPKPRDPHHPEGRRYALIVISDDGPGMTLEVLEHIFDPFFTTREVGRGMGLGLYIVQELVQELDGCIAVDSEPGRGTRFELALPCAFGQKETT